MPESFDLVPPHALAKGWHKPVTNPHLFIDGCVQIWPDTDYAKLHAYGVAAYCITTFRPDGDHSTSFDALANWIRVENQYPNIRIAMKASDIVAARRSNQAAIVIAAQSGDFLGPNLFRLEPFVRLGLRMMIPCYNKRNALGDGCLEPGNAGLSTMGRDFVATANRIGLLIDLSHVGERTSLDIMDATNAPVVFSHSNPRKLVDVARNITDEQIKRCAATGGVVGLTNFGPMNLRKGRMTRPGLADFVECVTYTADLVGEDHVSIGTDMSHGTYPDGDLVRARPGSKGSDYVRLIEASTRSKLRYCEGFDDYGQINQVGEALSNAGLSDGAIAKLMGGNLLRVFGRVWGG